MSFSIDNKAVDVVTSVTDLGVTIDTKLKFSAHIQKITRKAHSRACLIIRCFESRNVSALISAYSVYVRPIVEYCSEVWNPCLIKDINMLESVQRRFTKRLPGMRDLTYHQRLVALGLESLEMRRLRADLVFLYKIVFGHVKINLCDLFILNFSSNLRGHKFKLNLPPCHSAVRFSYFSYRIINVWNALPSGETDFTSIRTLKTSLMSKFLVRYCKVNFI